MRIELPNQFDPRWYQADAMSYFDCGGKRGAYCWPRRAGKDLTFVHQTAKAAHERIGMYFHLLPNHKQARKVVWDAIGTDGKRLIDIAFPPILRENVNEQEMKIKLRCGSLYQLVGADYFDSIVGSNPVGLVFSEFALTSPNAWHYFRPILAENGGWAAFISTPRGYNHFHELLENAKLSKEWDYSHLTSDQTKHITPQALAQEQSEMPDELFRQEYYTDFSAANIGSIFGKYIEAAEKDGRLGDVEYQADGAPLFISSDLGRRHISAFWFWQPVYGGFNLVDYDEGAGLDAEEWIERLKERIGERQLARIWLPHDARAKTFSAKHSAIEQFVRAFGSEHCGISPQTKKLHSISAGQKILPVCRFNAEKCKPGIAALRAWSFAYDDERKQYSSEPTQDWSTDASDAFCEGAKMLAERIEVPKADTRAVVLGIGPPKDETVERRPTIDELWDARQQYGGGRI